MGRPSTEGTAYYVVVALVAHNEGVASECLKSHKTAQLSGRAMVHISHRLYNLLNRHGALIPAAAHRFEAASTDESALVSRAVFQPLIQIAHGAHSSVFSDGVPGSIQTPV